MTSFPHVENQSFNTETILKTQNLSMHYHTPNGWFSKRQTPFSITSTYVFSQKQPWYSRWIRNDTFRAIG